MNQFNVKFVLGVPVSKSGKFPTRGEQFCQDIYTATRWCDSDNYEVSRNREITRIDESHP